MNNRMRNRRCVAALTAFAGFLALGMAAPAHAVAYNRVDRSGDGVVTYDEAYRSLNRMSEVHFNKCDRNGDGAVDRGEYGCLSGIYDSLYRDRNR